MARTTKNNNEEISVQGAEISSSSEQTEISLVNGEQVSDNEMPEWAKVLKEACEKTIASIEEFNKNAHSVVQDIILAAEQRPYGDNGISKTIIKEVDIEPNATYVVAPNRKFYDSNKGEFIGEGVNVTSLPPQKLKSLISQGIVVKKI